MAQWPDALVLRIELIDEPIQFFLNRPGQPDLHLGASFGEARRELYALVKFAQESDPTPGDKATGDPASGDKTPNT